MADDAKSKPVDTEVKSRLDALFSDEELPSANADKRDAPPEGPDPLEELRNLVMSIEWEITDDVMASFVAQIDSLKKKYGKDRIVVMFLQLLGSLGLYVRTYTAKAHPLSFKLIHSVYSGFDRVMTTENLSVSEKKKLLYVELNKYKELKEQIDQTKKGPRRERREVIPEAVRNAREEPPAETFEPSETPEEVAANPGDKMMRSDAEAPGDILQAIERLKAAIQKEFDSIRSEIQNLRST